MIVRMKWGSMKGKRQHQGRGFRSEADLSRAGSKLIISTEEMMDEERN